MTIGIRTKDVNERILTLDEVTILIKNWQFILALAAIAGGCAVALYRINKLDERIEGYMTTENHIKDCKIASFEIKDYFRFALNEFSEKLISKMKEQQKPIVDAIRRNADAIARLDRRTHHLKDTE